MVEQNPRTTEQGLELLAWLMHPDTDSVILDTETTGTAPRRGEASPYPDPEVIELGIISMQSGETLYEQRFRPEHPSTPEAQAVHNIPPQALQDQPPFREQIEKIREIAGNRPIIAWGAGFDERMLREEFNRAGEEELQNPWWCARKLHNLILYGDERKLKGTKGLGGSAEQMGIPEENAHTAIGDVRMIHKVLWHIHDNYISARGQDRKAGIKTGGSTFLSTGTVEPAGGPQR